MLSSASLSIPRREDLAALGCVGVIFRHDSCCCASAICGPEIVVEEVRRRGGSGNNMKSHEYDVTETSPAAGFLREPADRQPRPSSPRSTSGTLNPLPCHRKRRCCSIYGWRSAAYNFYWARSVKKTKRRGDAPCAMSIRPPAA